jgi:hypothetical protein
MKAAQDFINENKENILNGQKIDFPAQQNFININMIY